jgi:hypothetical protein
VSPPAYMLSRLTNWSLHSITLLPPIITCLLLYSPQNDRSRDAEPWGFLASLYYVQSPILARRAVAKSRVSVQPAQQQGLCPGAQRHRGQRRGARGRRRRERALAVMTRARAAVGKPLDTFLLARATIQMKPDSCDLGKLAHARGAS